MHNKTPICTHDTIHEDVVARAQEAMPDNKAFYELADLYKMFADSTRIKILWALSREEMCVCDLAALLDMTSSAVSHQLKSLRLARLVRFEKKGKIVYYSLVDDHARVFLEMGFEHIIE